MQSFSLLFKAGLLLFTAWILLPCQGFAQQALREAILVDRATESRQTNVALPRNLLEGLRIGPVLLEAGVSYGLELNDNVHLSETDPESDLIHRVGGDFRGVWPITQRSRLGFSLDAGYEIYTRQTRDNRVDLSPNTELGLDFGVKDFIFSFYDRLSYSQEIATEAALSDVQDYARFDNTIGTRVTWIPSKWTFALGYSHANQISATEDFNAQDYRAEQVFARIGYRFHPRTEAGLEASGAAADYTEFPRESLNYSVGPFLEWQVTETFRVSAHGGYVYYKTDTDPFAVTTNVLERNLDLATYYAHFGVQHQLTRFLSHGVSASRQIRPGVNQGGDYVEDNQVNYRVAWAMTRSLDLAAGFFYDWGVEPQVNLETAEEFEEEFNRIGFSVGLAWRMTQRFTAGVGYSFIMRESNRPDRDYSRNTGAMNIRYRF